MFKQTNQITLWLLMAAEISCIVGLEENRKVETLEVPDGKYFFAECDYDLGQVVEILDATYGPKQGTKATEECFYVDVTADVAGDCKGETWCELHPTKEKYGNPCKSLPKFLYASYICIEQSK